MKAKADTYKPDTDLSNDGRAYIVDKKYEQVFGVGCLRKHDDFLRMDGSSMLQDRSRITEMSNMMRRMDRN